MAKAFALARGMLNGKRNPRLLILTDGCFPAAEQLRERAIELVRSVERLLDDDRRCRVEEIEDAQLRRRHLLVAFRRRDGDASQRLLL